MAEAKNSFENKQTVLSSAKPFLKWAGGKSQLIKNISEYYPFTEKIDKYAEPFVGGGAVLFDILNKFTLKQVYLSDINASLINAYRCIRDNLEELLIILKQFENEYLALSEESKKQYYINKRNYYNQKEMSSAAECAALFIFFNKTCFNGLYRVNKKGEFNVPMGAYKNPLICNEENLRLVSLKLQHTEIFCRDYKDSIDFIDNKTFVYFDPPYRPITGTSNFTSYTESEFNDANQEELANFIKKVHKKGAKFLLSNSDPKNYDISDNFFDELYSEFKIIRVEASRMINSKKEGRGKIKEILISNY